MAKNLVNINLLDALQKKAATKEAISSWITDVRQNGWRLRNGDLTIQAPGMPTPLLRLIQQHVEKNLRTILEDAELDFEDEYSQILTDLEKEADSIKSAIAKERNPRN